MSKVSSFFRFDSLHFGATLYNCVACFGITMLESNFGEISNVSKSLGGLKIDLFLCMLQLHPEHSNLEHFT